MTRRRGRKRAKRQHKTKQKTMRTLKHMKDKSEEEGRRRKQNVKKWQPPQISKGLEGCIGNTPMIYLRTLSEASGCTILGKAEFLNPGQSVKDRAALFIIKNALNKNKLEPGGTIVEGTAGNTGIGIAMVANYYGIKTKIVIPNTQSEEKKDALRNLGAELIEVDAVPYSDTKNYVKFSKNIAEELEKKNKNSVY